MSVSSSYQLEPWTEPIVLLLPKNYNMVDVFFSYSHKDEAFRNELEVHLAMMKNQGLIGTWHDRRIPAGDDIDENISDRLNESNVVLCLVSPYFLASSYCFGIELKQALKSHEDGFARVIPVIVHPCDWHNSPLGKLRATPTDGKPISKFANAHDAYLEIVQDVRGAIKELGLDAPATSPRSSPKSTPVAPSMRSSNLRVKRAFSDREKDAFLDLTFEYISNYFENSLAELRAREPQLGTRMRRTGTLEFTAAIYDGSGVKVASCTIASEEGRIKFEPSDVRANSMFMSNQRLEIADDGYTLCWLNPYGFSYGESTKQMLSQEGAAEYLWSLFIKGIQ